MAELYYIDGYNLLHRDATLSALARQDLEAAREALVEAISGWCARSGNRACVIFDGRGVRADRLSGDPGRPNVEVVYTASNLSADAVIERGVYNTETRESVIVVSGDRGIRDLCLGLGALTMTPDHFLAMLHARGGVIPTGDRASRPSSGLGAVEDLVDEAARRQLHALRERLRRGD